MLGDRPDSQEFAAAGAGAGAGLTTRNEQDEPGPEVANGLLIDSTGFQFLKIDAANFLLIG